MLPHTIETLSSSDRGFPVNVCTVGGPAIIYGRAAANTWPVGRHLGLLNNRINEIRGTTTVTSRTAIDGSQPGP